MALLGLLYPDRSLVDRRCTVHCTLNQVLDGIIDSDGACSEMQCMHAAARDALSLEACLQLQDSSDYAHHPKPCGLLLGLPVQTLAATAHVATDRLVSPRDMPTTIAL